MTVTEELIDALEAEWQRPKTGDDVYLRPTLRRIAEIVLAAISLPVSNTGEWQPIETAPKDWSDMLLYDPDYPNDHHKVFQGYYDAEENDWLDAQNVNVHPTHWQPLPEAPK